LHRHLVPTVVLRTPRPWLRTPVRFGGCSSGSRWLAEARSIGFAQITRSQIRGRADRLPLRKATPFNCPTLNGKWVGEATGSVKYLCPCPNGPFQKRALVGVSQATTLRRTANAVPLALPQLLHVELPPPSGAKPYPPASQREHQDPEFFPDRRCRALRKSAPRIRSS